MALSLAWLAAGSGGGPDGGDAAGDERKLAVGGDKGVVAFSSRSEFSAVGGAAEAAARRRKEASGRHGIRGKLEIEDDSLGCNGCHSSPDGKANLEVQGISNFSIQSILNCLTFLHQI